MLSYRYVASNPLVRGWSLVFLSQLYRFAKKLLCLDVVGVFLEDIANLVQEPTVACSLVACNKVGRKLFFNTSMVQAFVPCTLPSRRLTY